MKLHRVAISTNDGNIDFWPDVGKNVGRSSVLKEAVGKAGDKITVNGRNLENLLNEEQVEAVDLVKIDIEGYEDQALIPFFKTASVGLFPKAVLLEIAHRKLWREGSRRDDETTGLPGGGRHQRNYIAGALGHFRLRLNHLTRFSSLMARHAETPRKRAETYFGNFLIPDAWVNVM